MLKALVLLWAAATFLLLNTLIGFVEQATAAPAPRVQDFLVRAEYLKHGRAGINKANTWRTMTYTRIRQTSFMGHRIMLHESVHEPLKCVEQHISIMCDDPYQINAVSGWRTRNTYRYPEISNHVFGLAIDIDPERNPCCGCNGKWAKVELCKGVKSHEVGPYELPDCWIAAFNAYGWAWLGDDPILHDTMHFEYLAKPGDFKCP